MKDDPYKNPTLECDIVMKGGITSGIVYPAAVCELAREFRFRSVGGTSAGAIAAALTAAAEAGREKGSFHKIQRLSHWFGEQTDGQSNLQSLFQPAKELEGLFRLFLKSIRSKPNTAAAAVILLFSSFPRRTILALLAGMVLAGLCYIFIGGYPGILLAAFSIFLPLLLALLSILRWLFNSILKTLPKNYFGLCTGAAPHESKKPSLTPWLSDLLNNLAGKENDQILTFGDLKKHNVDLQMLSTNLTFGRPYTLPIDTNIFFFKAEEMKDYFPNVVVRHMIERSASTESDRQLYPEYFRLPRPEDFPVIVATRMSLSFPLLLSAVKLYAIDFSKKDQAAQKPEPCWFSDGGICSNLPVQFFDAPLPTRPTFAINLRSYHEDYERDIYMPATNLGGILVSWDRFSDPPKMGSFLNSILETMQNWRDNSQIRMPGYRDRTVHIHLKSTEGGLNLSMTKKTIDDLVARGRAAGAELVRRYGSNVSQEVELNWENHRWVRFRSTMGALEHLLETLCDRLEDPAMIPTYKDLIFDHPSYRFTKKQQEFAIEAVNDLIEILKRWKAKEQSFSADAPSPQPSLRVVPDF